MTQLEIARMESKIKTLKEIIQKLCSKIEELAPESEENEELLTWALNWARSED